MSLAGAEAWLALIVGLGMVALAGAAESVLVATSRASLRDLVGRGAWRDEAVERLLARPHRTWATLVILETGGLLLGGMAAGWLIAAAPLPNPGGVVLALAFAIAAVALTYLAPRLGAASSPDLWALAVARPLHLAGLILTPFVAPVAELARRAGNGDLVFGSPIARGDEVRALVDAGEEEGLIEEDEKEMIVGVFGLSDTKVREVMVPRIDVVAIPSDASLDEALDAIIGAGHSRLPVYHDTLDDIRGLLYAKDLLTAFRTRDYSVDLTSRLRDPYFVPESKPVDELLTELQSRKVHMAIVVDEYGGTAGIVTIEDLLEEIVGEIQDEYDKEESRILLVSEDEGIFHAGVDIDDVNRLMGIELPTEEVDTLAGLVLDSLGRVPEIGEWATFPDARIEVQSVTGRRIHRVRVLRRPPSDAGGDGDSFADDSDGTDA
jgi:CBS domain containing-hemolysin-like protein